MTVVAITKPGEVPSMWIPVTSTDATEAAVGGSYEWLVIMALSVLIPLVAIVDMHRFRPPTWQRAQQNRPLWIALAIVLGPLGPLLYVTGPRLVLRRVVREARNEAAAATRPRRQAAGP